MGESKGPNRQMENYGAGKGSEAQCWQELPRAKRENGKKRMWQKAPLPQPKGPRREGTGGKGVILKAGRGQDVPKTNRPWPGAHLARRFRMVGQSWWCICAPMLRRGSVHRVHNQGRKSQKTT